VISPWLFNIFIDGVLAEINALVVERRAAMISDGGGKWQLNQRLYADDTTIVADET
jgi:hypothetical protein